jgi:hypothetical protein
MMLLCVWLPIWGAQTNKVNFFSDARATMVNLYIDTSFPQHRQVVERVLVVEMSIYWYFSLHLSEGSLLMLKFNPRHIRFELIDPDSVYILTLKKKYRKKILKKKLKKK